LGRHPGIRIRHVPMAGGRGHHHLHQMRWRGGVLVLLVTAVGLAGCGGSHTLTKSQFIAKADAICAKATADSNALPQPQSPPELVSLAQKTADIVRSMIKKLQALKATPKDKAVLQENFIAPSQAELFAA